MDQVPSEFGCDYVPRCLHTLLVNFCSGGAGFVKGAGAEFSAFCFGWMVSQETSLVMLT